MSREGSRRAFPRLLAEAPYRQEAGTGQRERHQGETEEYIQFHSSDGTMRERFGFAPAVSFEDGLRKLSAFFERERHAAGRQT